MGNDMAFEIVAERDFETVTMRRSSSLIAIAKARVWASEGWTVKIVVSEEAAAPGEESPLTLPALADQHPVLDLAS
jgi:hypothetical protein